MAKVKKEKFVFQSLDSAIGSPTVGEVPAQNAPISNVIPTFSAKPVFIAESNNSTKVTFDCSNELLELMKNYGYWEGLSQRDIIIEALNEFFTEKEVQERPDRVKNKKKVGRKPKSLTNFIR